MSVTNQATAAPQAALNATIATNGAPVTASGSFSGLNPGANSTALQVGLNTAVAGNYTGANAGSATISFVSDASNVGNCAPNCQLNLASQTVSVSGKVYTTAIGQSSTSVVDFGIVRVGDTVSAKNITVNNAAAVTGSTTPCAPACRACRARSRPAARPRAWPPRAAGRSAWGSAPPVPACSTRRARSRFTSQNPDMADVSAGANAGVQVKAQVNNLANGDFDLLAGLGLLTQQGNGNYVLNLGNVWRWAATATGRCSSTTRSTARPMRCEGLFDVSGADDFDLGGFGTVDELEAGQAAGRPGHRLQRHAAGPVPGRGGVQRLQLQRVRARHRAEPPADHHRQRDRPQRRWRQRARTRHAGPAAAVRPGSLARPRRPPNNAGVPDEPHPTRLSTTLLGLLALAAAVASIGLAQHNNGLRRDLAEQQQFVQQSVPLEGLYREMVRALAELSARNNDESLRALLQRHGITYNLQAPATAPAAAQPARK